MVEQKHFYTPDEYNAAKSANIIDFLQSIGYELTQNGREYHGVLHDSLVIREKGWYWNSRGNHGISPIELYTQILIHDFSYDKKTAYIEAIKQLAGTHGVHEIRESTQTLQVKSFGKFILPLKNHNNDHVIHYLCRVRKLDRYFVDGLIKYGKIYEERYTRNAVFVAYDKNGTARNAFLRGTIPGKPFKKSVDFSDKSYPFTLLGYKNSSKVYVYESAVDCISHAQIDQMHGSDWRDGHRISLSGTSFLALERFLQDNPQITEVVACLDNDATGDHRSAKLIDEYTKKGYTVTREKALLKDFGEDVENIFSQTMEKPSEDEYEFDD